MKRLSLQLVLLTCFIPFYATFAQRADWNMKDKVGNAKHVCRFVYPQGSAEIRSGLGNNAEVLSQLDSFIHSTVTNSRTFIRRIRLSGYSSIEGPYALNERLAYERVESFRDYLNVRYPELYRHPVDIVWVAEDWEGLSQLVRESDLREKEEALEIIHKIRSFDTREELLVKLNGGHAYRYMERYFFEQLRRVEIEIEYDHSLPPASSAVAPAEENDPLIYNVLEKADADPSKHAPEKVLQTLEATVTQLPKDSKEPSKYRIYESKPLFAIKTNVLQWTGVQPDLKYTAPVANFALEYFISSNWSVEAGAMYSYWRYNNNREFQGTSGYRLEPRYRYTFPCDWLEIYAGLYARFGDYDKKIEPTAEEKLTMGDDTNNYTGDYWDAGLSAGFTFGLGRGWAVEVGARVGYVSTKAIKYAEDVRYNWYESEQKYNKIRVTDLNVSLVYRFR